MIFEEMCLFVVAISRTNNSVNSILLLPLFTILTIFQMTFETAVGFLRNATLGGKTDSLYSPSSCVVMGKPWIGGTASFRVLQNLMASGGIKEKRKSSAGGKRARKLS